jgi:hypothetical protein
MIATKVAGIRVEFPERLLSRSATTDEPIPTQKKKIRFGCGTR